VKRILLLLVLSFAAGRPAVAETTAFVNVAVVPMTSEQVVTSRTVIVEGDRIETIGPVDRTEVPAGARVVDGTDRFLMPGLAEMHGHVPGAGSADLDRVLALYVANGITTVRGMLGQPSHLVLRTRIADGDVLGPRLVTSGPSMNGNSVAGPAAGSDMVRDQHAAGYDFVKIHPGLTWDEFEAIAKTAHELGMPVAGHVPEDVGLERALESRMATIDHLDGYMPALLPAHEDPSGGLGGFFGVFVGDQADPARIPPLVAETVAAGTWNVPTQSLFEHVTSPDLDTARLADRSEMLYMPAETVAQWQNARRELEADQNYTADKARRAIEVRRRLILEMQRQGAGLLLGSDSPQIFNVPGFAAHHELALLVAAGLTPFEALSTGTVNPARFFETDEFGTIEVGKTADLVLVDANPMEDIGNAARIHGVMLRGRWLSRGDLDELLDRFKR